MIASKDLKIYFPNLNGLRFIGAFFVIINHTEQLKVFYKIGDGVSDFARNIGKLGVMLFFVLSGFLITYLLLTEEKTFGKIHVKKFYIRRFLRIVPLYALLILLAFFVIPYISFFEIPDLANPLIENFTPIILLHLFFIPNFATAIFGFIPYIAQAWSIGTEGQSYLLWPFLLREIKSNRIYFMIGIVLLHFFVRVILSDQFFIQIPEREILQRFWVHFNVDAIAIVSIFAILFIDKSAILKYILNIKFFYLISFIVILFLALAIKIPHFHYQVYAILFGVIVLNLAVNDKLKNVLEWNVLNYLGKISYGIYMYHFIVLIPVLVFASKIETDSIILIYSLILTITIFISSISYHYFETFFLNKKRKYTLIKSGDPITLLKKGQQTTNNKQQKTTNNNE